MSGSQLQWPSLGFSSSKKLEFGFVGSTNPFNPRPPISDEDGKMKQDVIDEYGGLGVLPTRLTKKSSSEVKEAIGSLKIESIPKKIMMEIEHNPQQKLPEFTAGLDEAEPDLYQYVGMGTSEAGMVQPLIQDDDGDQIDIVRESNINFEKDVKLFLQDPRRYAATPMEHRSALERVGSLVPESQRGTVLAPAPVARATPAAPVARAAPAPPAAPTVIPGSRITSAVS